MEMNKKMKIILSIIISIVILSTGYYYIQSKYKIEELPYNLFLNHVEKGLIEEVQLSNSGKIKVKLTNGTIKITDNPRTDSFKEELLLYDIKVVEKDNEFNQLIPIIILVSIMGLTIFYLNKNMSKQAEKEMSNMSKIDTDTISNKRIKFADVEIGRASCRERV